MKKHIISGGLLLMAAAFTACTEDFKDWASPQTNGTEDAITIQGFTASAVDAQNLASAGDEVPTFTLNSASLPEGYSLGNARIELTPQGVEDASKTIINTTIEGLASKEKLQELIVAAYGRKPVNRTFDGHVLVNAVKDGQAVYIDAGTITVNLTPEAPQIAQNYYVVGGTLDWAGSAASKEQKFSHSDADVYDDPIFTIVIDASAGDTWFAIGDDEGLDAITNNGDWTKLFGIVGGDSNATSGQLDYRYNLGADNSFCVKAGAKKIKITIDMMERTFLVETISIADKYFLIGGPGDWSADAARTMQFSHSDKDVFEDPVFTYFFDGTGSDMWFAFGDEAAIDAVAAGDWTQLYGTTGASEDLKGTFKRRTELDGDHSFHIDGQAKHYRLTIDMVDMTYEIAALNFEPFVYFIGATDGWGAAEQKLALTDEASGIYTGYLYMADPNGWGNQFKFQKEPGNWDSQINSGHMTGGITGDLADGGDNFSATAGEGVYFVELNLSANSLKGTRITNMNLVGDFNGWNAADDAQQMTWNATDYCFEISGAGVTANGWKFTANNAWDINLGGKTLDDLFANGDNITVAGNTIKLYPTRKTSDKIYCTVE
ncbi:MAG: DUF5115 domain-containing protein [Prevotella sp.]|nr:DUF5115 domain-containing protein [Prevotella sp.]